MAVFHSGTDTATAVFAYDEFDRLTNAASTVSYRFEYGPTNRLVRETLDGFGTLHHGYDAYGRSSRLDLEIDGTPRGSVVYGYDTQDRISTVAFTNAAGRGAVAVYSYRAGRNMGYTVSTDSAVLSRELQRDDFRQDLVTNIEISVNGVSAQNWEYTYDALHRPVTRNADAFAYDARSEVTNAVVSGSATGYAYDEIGNWTRSGTTTFAADELNRLTQYGTRTVVSDADGNTLSLGMGMGYVYDAENRLVLASNNTQRITSEYDPFSRRIRKVYERKVSGVWRINTENTYLYDGWNLVYEREVSGSMTNDYEYFWGHYHPTGRVA